MTGQQLTIDDIAVAALANRPGPTHRQDPSTSRRAAMDNLPRSGSQRARVLAALHAAGDYGCTDFELHQQLGILRTAAGTRRKELADRFGLVVATPRERVTDTGSMAVVHVLTDAGYEVARRLAQVPA